MDGELRVLNWSDMVNPEQFPGITVRFMVEKDPEFLKMCVVRSKNICVTDEIMGTLKFKYDKCVAELNRESETSEARKKLKKLWCNQVEFEFYNNFRLEQILLKIEKQIAQNTEEFKQMELRNFYQAPFHLNSRESFSAFWTTFFQYWHN